MGREIEVKIPLTIEEYDFLNLLINSERTLEGVKISSKPEILFKKDEYLVPAIVALRFTVSKTISPF